MPRAPKLKPAGENGTITIEEIIVSQQAALAQWPANHYSSEIGFQCGLAEVLAALGRLDEAVLLLNRSHRDCWVAHRYRSSYGVALQLIHRGETASARSLTEQLDAEVAERAFIGETNTVIRGASASVWFKLGETERSRQTLAEAHQAAIDEPSNPTQPWPHLAQAYALCGRLDEALEALTHTRSFYEVAVSQIALKAVEMGQPEVLDRTLEVNRLDGYRIPEVLHSLRDRLRLKHELELFGMILPRLIGRNREEDVEALFIVWWKAGWRDDAQTLAEQWHALKPDPRSAAALAVCGQLEAGRAMQAELPEMKWISQARQWSALLGALGEAERAGVLWSDSEALSVVCRAAFWAGLAGQEEATSNLLEQAWVLTTNPLSQAQVASAHLRCGSAIGDEHFTAVRRVIAAQKGSSRSPDLHTLVGWHGAACDLPGGQATATKLRAGNQRDRALDRLSAVALQSQDVAAAMILANSMKDPTEKVKTIARVLHTVARRQGLLAPSMLSLSIYWLMQ